MIEAWRYFKVEMWLMAKSEFCKANGTGVSLHNKTMRNASVSEFSKVCNLRIIDPESAL